MDSKPQNSVAGIILAGGISRRMGGGDKGEIVIGGKTILERIIEALGQQVGQLVINANGDPSRFQKYGLPVLSDAFESYAGPLAGMLAGLEWARRHGYSTAVTVTCDTPFLPRNLVTRLQEAGAFRICANAASGGRIHHAIGHWRSVVAHDLRHSLEDLEIRKVADWTSRLDPAIAEWPIEPYDPFFNINKPNDLMEAKRIAGEYGT
jgi:molybdopterin-guanine dinucleotide biosynthesis protein A